VLLFRYGSANDQTTPLYSPSLPLSHSENFPTVTDELHVKVLDAPPDLAPVLRVRRTRKINLNTELTAPSTLKASADGSIVITLTRLTLTILQAQSISEADSKVCTKAAGKVRTIIQPGPKTAQLLNNCRIFCLNKRIRFQTGSIVATIAVRLVATKKSSLNCFSVHRDSLTHSPDKLLGLHQGQKM
jgi:hypothetical protein